MVGEVSGLQAINLTGFVPYVNIYIYIHITREYGYYPLTLIDMDPQA